MCANVFDARGAVEAIRAAESYEEGLRRRTEGITWMLWGLVLAGIWVSYGLAYTFPGIDDSPLEETLWLPWTLAGWLATFALWRSAALSSARGEPAPRRAWLRHVASAAALIVGVSLVFWWLGPRAAAPLFPLLVVGGVTLLAGVMPWSRGSRESRLVSLLAATVIGATAAMLAWRGAGEDAIGLAGTLVCGGTYLAGGFWLTLRG